MAVQELKEVTECSNCQVEAEVTLHQPPIGSSRYGEYKLCSLCANTFIGNAYCYPKNYPDVSPIMLAQAIHWLRKELQK